MVFRAERRTIINMTVAAPVFDCGRRHLIRLCYFKLPYNMFAAWHLKVELGANIFKLRGRFESFHRLRPYCECPFTVPTSYSRVHPNFGVNPRGRLVCFHLEISGQ